MDFQPIHLGTAVHPLLPTRRENNWHRACGNLEDNHFSVRLALCGTVAGLLDNRDNTEYFGAFYRQFFVAFPYQATLARAPRG